MIILMSVISLVVSVLSGLISGYLYRKEDERYRYTGVVSIVTGVIGLTGLAGFLLMF